MNASREGKKRTTGPQVTLGDASPQARRNR